jgi:hypothetical protein
MKPSMWQKRGSIRHRRPSLDALEDRYLLSGVDAPSSPPPPAALLQRLLQAAPIGIGAPTVSLARLPFQALTDHAAAIGPDAMTGPVATPSPSPLAVTVHALASLSDGIAVLPIPPALPAWIGHALPSGPDPAPGPIASPAVLAATDHMLAGLSDGIAGRPARTAWATLADQMAAGNPDPAEGPPSHREFLLQAARALMSGPDAVAGLPPRVVSLDWAHHVDLSRLGVVPPPPHPENGRTNPGASLAASQLETMAGHHGNDVGLVARVGLEKCEHLYDELTARVATGRSIRIASLLADRFAFDERGAGVAQIDKPPAVMSESDRETPSPPSLTPRTTCDTKLAATTATPAESAAGTEGEVPSPQGAGLIADVLPLNRASLERAIERFLDGFEDLAAGPAGWRGSPGPIRALLMLMVATTAEAARRRLRRVSDDAKDEHERGPEEPMVLPAFPELPGSWSMRA